jgi:hypothetical protein
MATGKSSTPQDRCYGIYSHALFLASAAYIPGKHLEQLAEFSVT